jgi:iron complex outermembrane receptor protein
MRSICGCAGDSGFVNYLDGYRNTAVMPVERVSSWTTVDLQVGYDLPVPRGPLHGTRLALSVTNLFDRDPPYVNNPTSFSAIGYDSDNANPIGRLVAFQVIKSW